MQNCFKQAAYITDFQFHFQEEGILKLDIEQKPTKDGWIVQPVNWPCEVNLQVLVLSTLWLVLLKGVVDGSDCFFIIK